MAERHKSSYENNQSVNSSTIIIMAIGTVMPFLA